MRESNTNNKQWCKKWQDTCVCSLVCQLVRNHKQVNPREACSRAQVRYLHTFIWISVKWVKRIRYDLIILTDCDMKLCSEYR